jgi:hypothetical protein
MLLKTSTITAPWTIVEGNSKYYARVKALKTIVETLEQELEPFDKTSPVLPAKKKPKKRKRKKKKSKN